MLTEIHSYGFGELAFLGFFLLMALLSSYIPRAMWPHLDPKVRAEKAAEQARIDAAPVNSPTAARPRPTMGGLRTRTDP